MARKDETLEEEKKRKETADGAVEIEISDGTEEEQETPGAAETESDGDAAETQEDGGDAAESDDGSRKSLFGKKKDKAEKTDPLKEQVKELQDKVMRQMAEFENFRKRTDKEKSQMFDAGAAHVIEKLLPTVDNFERGLAAAQVADKPLPTVEEFAEKGATASDKAKGADAFAEGMQMIYKQLVKALEDLGVTPIEALGKEFDPNFHNAVMQVEASETYPSGTVAQEMQKGYLYHDTVIRHSMVAVAE